MKTTQYCIPLLVLGAPLMVLNFLLTIKNFEKYEDTVIALTLIILLAVALFYKLDVTITDNRIKVDFGFGFIKRRFRLASVKSVSVVKNPILAGWGIRAAKKFILYNVSGLSAVELSFKDGRKKVRIGTNRPDELASEISKRLE